MTIEKLMTRNVCVCHAYETLDHAAQRMWDSDIGALPVLDDEHHLAGMITDRDVCMASYTQASAPGEIIVGEVMSKHPISCGLSDGPVAVAELMRRHQLRRIPVVDGDRHVVGVVTINDLARSGAVPKADLLAVFAALARPRHAAHDTAAA